MHGLAIWNCPYGDGAFAHSFKAPRRGDCGFVSPVLIPHSPQPLPNQFSCLSQDTLLKDQESLQNGLLD